MRAPWILWLMVLALAGCSSTGPRPGQAPRDLDPPPERDGPGTHPPPDLHLVPDAQPRIEPLRSGGPNKPYEVLGWRYDPVQGDAAMSERGLASWYGRKFHGRRTANGEVYDMYAMTAAHKTMPLPSYARVRNPSNGREVVVRVNDRGPFHDDRVIDLSYTAALRLGLLGGVAPVEVERITHEAIRAGLWRMPPPAGPTEAVAEAGPRPSTRLASRSAVAPMPEPAGGVADPIAEFARPVPEVSIVATRTAEATKAAPPAGSGPSATTALAASVPAEGPAPVAAPGFWLQLGAFREPAGAAGLQQRLQREADWLTPLLGIFSDNTWHRLQAGPFARREDALVAARRLRELLPRDVGLVERR